MIYKKCQYTYINILVPGNLLDKIEELVEANLPLAAVVHLVKELLELVVGHLVVDARQEVPHITEGYSKQEDKGKCRY